jgi:hypothetical protein
MTEQMTEPQAALAVPMTPMTLIERALVKGIDPEQLSRLMDLQERYEKRQAADEFGRALAEFQKRCPAVFKWREMKGTNQSYKFASLDDVMRAAGPVLAECGISISFDTSHENNMLKVTCRIRVGSHSEDKTFTTPVPDMRVNDTQRFGAALTYAKRYAICAALNIVTTDQDVDASNLENYVSLGQIKQLDDLIVEKGVDKKRFLAWANVADLDLILARDFPKVLTTLQQRKAGAR